MASKNNSPLVSIIVPCYNADKFLGKCIESIISQTYQNKELIIIDDCSTDKSFQISQKYSHEYPWIKVIKNIVNLGVADTFNVGIKQSKADYLARMDADDIMLPNRIEKQIDFLIKNPDVVIVGGQCQIVDSNDIEIGQKKFPLTDKAIKTMMFTSVPMQQPTIMINRTLVPSDQLVSKKRFSPAEDYDLFFSLARFGKFANLPDTTIKYREHNTNISLTKPKFTFWRIQDARLYAVINYGYKPSILSILIAIGQTIAVLLLPQNLIYPLHKLTRRMNRP